MERREFIKLLGGAVLVWPFGAQAQNQAGGNLDAHAQVGQVATLQGTATVIHGNGATATLKVEDAVYRKDVLQTGPNSSLGVTFDDETTFSLSANARIVVNEFVYEDAGNANIAAFNVARGTVAFIASVVAKTGNMTISTPTASLGIRGTTGIVDVPDSAVAGAGEAKIKLYPDADGYVGRIEVFNRQGGRLGALTQGSSAFAIRPGLGGQFAAVPFRIPPQEAARDRGSVQRLVASHNIGRQMTIRRRQLRTPNRPQPNNLRQPGGPKQKGNLGTPQRGGSRQKPRNLKKKNEPLR